MIPVVLHQPEASGCVEAGADGIHFPADVTVCDMQPVVVLEELDLTR